MHDGPIVDPHTAACLGNGYHAAVAVRADGDTELWLFVAHAPAERADEHTTGHQDGGGCSCQRCAPHEQTGGLPHGVRKRLHGECQMPGCERAANARGVWCPWHSHLTCSAMTRAGKPCRAMSGEDGRCRQHRPRKRQGGR